MPHDPVDLRSDTVTRPTPEMRKAMAEAIVGDDVFGDDPTVQELECLSARIIGKEDAVYVPSGTMGNEVAILTHTQRGQEAIVEFDSHIYNYETAGPAVLSGVQLAPIKAERGILLRNQIEEAIRPDDVHEPVTRLVCLENTHNRAGGVIYPIEVMQDIYDLAKRRGLRIHLDGARIFNAAVATDIDVREYCALCDSVMFCLSKGLGAPIGSMLVGDGEFIRLARRYRKLLGGGMRQVGIIAAAGAYALEHNIDRLREDHKRARDLAERLASIPNIEIDLETVQTNIIVIDVRGSGLSVEDSVLLLEKQGVLVVPFGRTTVRAVTHLDIDDADMEKAVTVFEMVFSKAS
jgi:threonine aldolase